MIKLDLSTLYKEYAKKYVAELKGLVRIRYGFDGDRYSNIEDSTRLTGSKKEGKKFRRRDSRLNDTGNYSKHAFKSQPSDIGFRVYTSDDPHPFGGKKAVTYAQITEYNDLGSPKKNKNIRKAPKIFPRTEAEVHKMGIYRDFIDDLNKTIEEQMQSPENQTKHTTIVSI